MQRRTKLWHLKDQDVDTLISLTFLLISFVLQDLLNITEPVFIRLCTQLHCPHHGVQLIQCKLVTGKKHKTKHDNAI